MLLNPPYPTNPAPFKECPPNPTTCGATNPALAPTIPAPVPRILAVGAAMIPLAPTTPGPQRAPAPNPTVPNPTVPNPVPTKVDPVLTAEAVLIAAEFNPVANPAFVIPNYYKNSK
jgi:hypothetical protein